MSSTRQGRPPKAPKPTSPKVERRRLADRKRILEVAAARFAESGPEAVRLDEIAELAGVARGTLYSHFPSKEALSIELMRAVFDDALAELQKAEKARSARDRVTALLGVYLVLWERHADALRMSHRMMRASRGGATGVMVVPFVRGVISLLAGAGRAGILRAPSAEVAGRTLARVAVPLLELYAPLPGGPELFVESVRALLLKEERKHDA